MKVFVQNYFKLFKNLWVRESMIVFKYILFINNYNKRNVSHEWFNVCEHLVKQIYRHLLLSEKRVTTINL